MDQPMRTLDDLVKHTGMSKSFWYKQSSRQKIVCSKFGSEIRFTPEQWDATLALFEQRPKVVPTRDQVAAKRAEAARRSPARGRRVA